MLYIYSEGSGEKMRMRRLVCGHLLAEKKDPCAVSGSEIMARESLQLTKQWIFRHRTAFRLVYVNSLIRTHL